MDRPDSTPAYRLLIAGLPVSKTARTPRPISRVGKSLPQGRIVLSNC